MAYLGFKKIDLLFHIVCIVFVLVYAICSIYDYFKNEDICEVSFKTFHSKDWGPRYPAFTMCLSSPFIEEKWSKLATTINTSQYNSYLLGGVQGDERLQNIAYENVSATENDFIIDAVLKYKDENRTFINVTDIRTHSWGMKSHVTKCFTFGVPFLKNALADVLTININNSIFPNGKRPSDGWKQGGMQIFDHYPGQFGRSYSSNRRFWNTRYSNKSYIMRFYFKGMEVLAKRHKRYEECEENNMKSYDDSVVEYILNTLQCRPPYMDGTEKNYPVCTDKEKLMKARTMFTKILLGISDLLGPCTEVRKVDLNYEETDNEDIDPGQATIKLYFVSKGYKEIRQIRAYGIMALFGNVGGFVGLLLGYALVHFPGFMHSTFSYFKKGTQKGQK